MQIQSKVVYKVTMGLEPEPNVVSQKAKWFNMLDEASGFLCLSISRYFLFHIEKDSTRNEVWIKIESFFGKQDEMRGHLLDNELISLSPRSFKIMEEFI